MGAQRVTYDKMRKLVAREISPPEEERRYFSADEAQRSAWRAAPLAAAPPAALVRAGAFLSLAACDFSFPLVT